MISFVEYLHLLRHAAETTCSGNNTHFLAAAAGIQVVGNFCCCIAWLGLRGNSCKQTRRSLRRVVGFFFTLDSALSPAELGGSILASCVLNSAWIPRPAELGVNLNWAST
jgi:hypothetical protein